MKIGIISANSANESYTWSKTLHQLGNDVIQFSDSVHIADNPIWAETKIEIPINDEINSVFFSTKQFKKIKKIETEYNWDNPYWFHRFQEINTNLKDIKLRNIKHFLGNYSKGLFETLRCNYSTKNLPGSYLKISKIMNELENCDVVLCQGWQIIIPYLKNVPFVVVPYGSEISLQGHKKNFFDPLKSSYKICSIAGIYQEWLNGLGLTNYTPFHSYVDTTIFKPLEVDEDCFSFQKKIKNKFVFFMPSRMHYFYKGTDKVINAFKRINRDYEQSVLVLINWGDDKIKVKSKIMELGLVDNVIILNYFFSHKSQNLLFNLSNVILDQFPATWKSTNLGGLGRNASLTGKPIMSTYSEEYNQFLNKDDHPPIINANTEEEIYLAMKFCLENKKEVEEIGKKMRNWGLEHYGMNAVKKLEYLLKDASKFTGY